MYFVGRPRIDEDGDEVMYFSVQLSPPVVGKSQSRFDLNRDLMAISDSI